MLVCSCSVIFVVDHGAETVRRVWSRRLRFLQIWLWVCTCGCFCSRPGNCLLLWSVLRNVGVSICALYFTVNDLLGCLSLLLLILVWGTLGIGVFFLVVIVSSRIFIVATVVVLATATASPTTFSVMLLILAGIITVWWRFLQLFHVIWFFCLLCILLLLIILTTIVNEPTALVPTTFVLTFRSFFPLRLRLLFFRLVTLQLIYLRFLIIFRFFGVVSDCAVRVVMCLATQNTSIICRWDDMLLLFDLRLCSRKYLRALTLKFNSCCFLHLLQIYRIQIKL